MDKYTKESIDWDSYREHIWVWYMVDNKSLSDILEILKQDGVVATKQQLEFRLKKWRISKTIKTQEARWMGKQLDISRKACKPIIFVKSGKILPESQVAQAVKRHAPLPSFAQKFNTDSDVQLHFSPADLIVCSPGPADSYPRGIEPWGFHSTLPWIRFRCALLDGSFQIQIRRDARTSMPPNHLLPMTFASQSYSDSGLEVCKFASNLAHIMPEVYTGEHIRRICAIAQAQASLTIDLLEILIFQLSNNFLDDNGDFDSEHIVHLMGAFGLDNSRTIRFLFEAAADQPTIVAILDKFWKAAYETSSTEIASIIFTEFLRRYDGSDEFGLDISTPLQLAIDTENFDLAKIILSGPKSIHITKRLSLDGPGLLAYCSEARNHDFALAMAALLLERHDSISKIINESHPNQGPNRFYYHGVDHIPRALHSGNTRLARMFWEAGFNIRQPCDEWEVLDVAYCEDQTTSCIGSIIGNQTIFTAAVVPHVLLNDKARIRVRRDKPNDRFANKTEAEELTLENYFGLAEILSEMGKLPEWLEGASSSTQSPDLDVVVLAALYGYDKLLQTFKHSPSSLNRANSEGMCPLSAAAMGGNALTCRLLVRLGADPDYVPPFGDWPTPLHHAVYNDSTHLVEVLLDLGADINHRSYTPHKTFRCCGEYRGPKSALALAIALRHWETAFLLIHREAEIDSFAFDLAVHSGNSTLMDLLSNAKLYECLLGSHFEGEHVESVISIVPGDLIAAEYHGIYGLKGQQMTCDVLSKAVSAGSLGLMSRILRMKQSGPTHHSLQYALTCSLERGFGDISRELIRAGAKMTTYDLAMSFRSSTLTSIHEIIKTSSGPPLSIVNRGQQEFALELSILDNTPDVVQFALEMFPQAYSSGALSAAVLRAAKSGFQDSQEPVKELLLRRSSVGLEQIDPFLENTAVAIAMLFQAPAEVTESLLKRPYPEIPAICCLDRWSKKPSVDIADQHKILLEIFLAQRNPQNVGHVKGLHYTERSVWCSERLLDNVMAILPLTLAINLRNDQVYTRLMARGFLANCRTLEAAIQEHTSLEVLERVLRSCKEGHDIIKPWDDILHFALDCEDDQVMRFLIQNGASISARRYGGPTVLQAAVARCRSPSLRRSVQLLLDAGAEVNEAIGDPYGRTALQAAVLNGQLDLVRQLVNLGADIDAHRAVRYGLTCLEAAAWEGRLDVAQFLLDAGATTTGKGQLQYIRAMKLAEENGHAAVAQILRKYRPWDESDEALFQQVKLTHARRTIVLHPIEYTLEEIHNLKKEIFSFASDVWKDIWPKIDPSESDIWESDLWEIDPSESDPSEREGIDFINDDENTHHSADINEAIPMHQGLMVASNSQPVYDVLDDGSPGSCESETDWLISQMVVSNSTSDYSMPLHTSFTRFQTDPDFYERIFEMEDD